MNTLIVEKTGPNNEIVKVILNRPTRKHAFNTEMAKELLQTFEQIQNDTDIRVVILTSSTEDSFCSGADLKERKGMSDQEWKEQHSLFEKMIYTLEDLPQPTIAIVNGYALAGGFELSLNCDLIIASENAIFGLPEVKRGIMPGIGASRLLPQRVPLHIAKEWLFTGRMVSAKEAEKWGLLNAVVQQSDLHSKAIDIAQQICNNAPLGVQGTKKVAHRAFSMNVEQARVYEIEVYENMIHSEDRLEGVLAFNEKRKPKFKGR
ncbi:enoyl-CoA hydratase/isomerase family protein [Peribacillus asahii]|uniref:enoyl-CoA hydratase/isomerase family protein n=1 Tax=Peribacillus asahii TaxID=228899 RepID=UPI0037F22F3B